MDFGIKDAYSKLSIDKSLVKNSLFSVPTSKFSVEKARSDPVNIIFGSSFFLID
jgi:hypothetical protein